MRYWVIILLLFPLALCAQNSKMGSRLADIHPIDKTLTRSYFNIGQQIDTDNEAVLEFVKSFAKYNNPAFYDYQLINRIESPKAYHLLYQQYYEGTKVYRGQIKVNLDKQGNILSVFDNSLSAEKASDAFPSEATISTKINSLYPEKNQLVRATPELCWFWDSETLTPAARIELVDLNDQFYEVIIDHTSNTIYHQDLNSYHHAALDTPAAARVFLPDPLTTAQVEYGTPYEDSNDADISQLNFQRQQVAIEVDFNQGTFSLKGPYCEILDFSSPFVQPANKTEPLFDYTRSQDGFEDVNAFYHIHVFQDYVQLLGFTNLASYAIHVDCHALNGADNSNFNPGFGVPRLSFGEGGVDDAEDADVIIHEYGHALSFAGSPNTNSGVERQALDEGVGDYLCSSYSRSINPYRWQDVFTWDGHNEYWSGRSAVTNDHYPENLSSSIHSDADIWAATLMQIWEDIGREPTDAIQLQSLYSYATNMSMRDAAYVFLQADELYYGGAHAWPITYWMKERGLLPADVGINDVATNMKFRLLNSIGFTQGNSDAILQLPSTDKATIEMFDVTGKMVYTLQLQNSNTYALSGENYKAGIYILTVEQNGSRENFKLIKQ